MTSTVTERTLTLVECDKALQAITVRIKAERTRRRTDVAVIEALLLRRDHLLDSRPRTPDH